MSILIVLVAAWGLGRAVVGPLAIPDALERTGLAFLCGLAPVAAVILLAGSVSLAWSAALVALIGFCALLVEFWRSRVRPKTSESHAGEPLPWLAWCAVAALASSWFLTLISALAPVTSWDATVAHLALPSDYAREGRIFLHPGNVYSGYPQFVHVCYGLVYYLGGSGREVMVSLFNWFFGLLACVSVYSLGLRAGGRQTGLVAAAILATAPIYMDQAGGPGIDLPFAAYSTAALASLFAWKGEGKRGWLVVAGLLAGASCGIRHTGLLVCALLVIGVVAADWRGRPLRALMLFAVPAAAAAAPWLLRTWLVVGNPVFPFFLSVFPEPAIDHIAITAAGAHESIERSNGLGLLALLRFPWDIIMRPQLYDGWNKSPGGLVLILGVPGLLLGGIRAWSLGSFSVAGGTVFFFFQRLARYLLPFFTPMMVVAALAVERLPRGRRAVALLVVFSFIYGLALHGAAMHFKVKVVLGLETKAAYLESRVERYPAFHYANAHLNDGGTMLMIDQRSYFIDGPTFQNHWSLKKIAGLPLAEQVAWLKAHGIAYVMVPVDFVEGSGALSGGIAAMLAEWRRHPATFEPVRPPMILPKPRGGGVEEVLFYAVR